METRKTEPKIRKLTVCNKGFQRQRGNYPNDVVFLPVICLTGKWLEEMGFRAGHTVDVTCEKRKLMITISERQRFEDV